MGFLQDTKRTLGLSMLISGVTVMASAIALHTIPEGMTSVVIHCASMVTVDPSYSEKLMAV